MTVDLFVLPAGGWHRCTAAWSQPAGDLSDTAKLYFPSRGRAALAIDGRRTTLQPGKVYFVPPYRLVQRWCERRLDLWWLHLRPTAPALHSALMRGDRVLAWPAARWRHWRPTYTQIDRVLDAGDLPTHCRVQAMVLDLVADAVARTADRVDPGLAAMVARLDPAIRYMDSRFRANPPLAEVAEQVHLSPLYFQRLFRRAMGLTPHDYMLRHRMMLARSLLSTTTEPIKAVAMRCGYDNPYYFSRIVRQYLRQSPRQIRHAHRDPAMSV